MPLPSPFHAQTAARCESLLYKDWAGYHSVRSYETCHEREYFALRESAGLIDVSPLFKYRFRGPDAAAALDRLVTRKVRRAKIGSVLYTCWCDERGKILDDGTVTRLARDDFRVTSALPNLHWFEDVAYGLDVRIEDESPALGALSLQGPRARDILDEASRGAVRTLKFFRHTRARIAGAEVEVTRTGYTGDLGYEVWVAPDRAEQVYEAIAAAGRAYGLAPVGLDAMDVARLEAGFVLCGVDYVSAREAVIPSQLSSPFEVGLGWTVHLDEKKGPFVGRNALEREAREPSGWRLVGLACEWSEIESLYARFGLPPAVGSAAWRDGRPVYGSREGRQVGRATSGTWSPLLKKNIALATVLRELSEPGQRLYLEMTVEYERHRVCARVVPLPFFDPPRKRETPAA